MQLPIGVDESQELEFKGRDALEDLKSISREVVAMLNAVGGNVWIGIREESEKAIGIEPLDEPLVARRRIEDHLADAIAPAPSGREVAVHADEAARVIRIQCTPLPANRPYAQLKNGARYYLIRTGARMRAMTEFEIRSAYTSQGSRRPEPDLDAMCTTWLQERDRLFQGPSHRLVLRITHSSKSELDFADSQQQRIIHRLLEDPALSGNRQRGYTVFTKYLVPENAGGGSIRIGANGKYLLEVRDEGSLVFGASLNVLSSGQSRAIWPYALLELPTSFVRLAKCVLELLPDLHDDDAILFDLAMSGLGEWTLGPGEPRTIQYDFEVRSAPADVYARDPFQEAWSEVRQASDRLAYRAVRAFYSWFGFNEDDIVPGFDHESGRLTLPD